MRKRPPCSAVGCRQNRYRYRFGLVPDRYEEADRCEEHYFQQFVQREADPIPVTVVRVRGRRKARATKREGNPKWRQAVLERDGHACVDCGSTERLHAHHLTYVSMAPEKQHDLDNGVTVCVWCHAARHAGEAAEHLLLRGAS